MFTNYNQLELVKNLPTMKGPGFDPWVEKIPWRRN